MINFVIVLFNRLISESETINYLEKNISREFLKSKFQVIIYDNSSVSQKVPLSYSSITSYVHDRSNGGVASAYNYGLSLTRSTDDWLVLLDQDTGLPEQYIDEVLHLTAKCNNDNVIVAIVPHVLCNNKIISPCNVYVGGMLCPVALHFRGKRSREVRAINSGMVVRTSFMRQIGGFNNEFWLDYLDYWLCRTMYTTGKTIYVCNSVINHNLSVSDYNQVSEQRARNILQAEMIFYKKYMPWYEQVLYGFRLLCRSLKQLLMVDNKHIALNTMRMIPQIFRTQY